MINAQIVGSIEDLTEVYTLVEDAKEDVEILINSPGGSAIEAINLVNAVENSEQQITARVEVMAASAAAVIALGCDKLMVSNRAIIMLHNCWTVAVGNAEEMQNQVEAMHAVDNALQDIVTKHCSEENAAYIRERMDSGELWLTGSQMAELFDNVEVFETPAKQGLKAADGCLADLVDAYNNAIAKIAELEAKAKEEEKPEEEQEQPEEAPAEEPTEEEQEEESKKEHKAEYIITDEVRAILEEVL